jgi:hypothetical protein
MRGGESKKVKERERVCEGESEREGGRERGRKRKIERERERETVRGWDFIHNFGLLLSPPPSTGRFTKAAKNFLAAKRLSLFPVEAEPQWRTNEGSLVRIRLDSFWAG